MSLPLVFTLLPKKREEVDNIFYGMFFYNAKLLEVFQLLKYIKYFSFA